MILGIDPGRGKTGWVITDEGGELLLSGIFPTGEGERFFQGMKELAPETIAPFVLEGGADKIGGIRLRECVIGNGTGRELLFSLAQTLPLRVKLVPEKGTTLLSRDLTGEYTPKGLLRILPLPSRAPRDVDDLAAWAIVLRHLQLQKKKREEGEKENGN
ncbi:hypothetical protein MASR2M17_00050 [Aminivibrio sp.]